MQANLITATVTWSNSVHQIRQRILNLVPTNFHEFSNLFNILTRYLTLRNRRIPMQANPIAASHGLILFTKSDNEFQI